MISFYIKINSSSMSITRVSFRNLFKGGKCKIWLSKGVGQLVHGIIADLKAVAAAKIYTKTSRGGANGF